MRRRLAFRTVPGITVEGCFFIMAANCAWMLVAM
jgi:hypothetical protein